MRKLVIYGFTVFLPALIVGISNFSVFPDSSLIATIMLIITVGVAGVFTYFSGDATPVVRRYCVIADIIICAVLCFNLGGHWILAREVSAARQGVEERHFEEDRDLQRKKAETELEISRKQAEAELAKQNAILQNAERRRLATLPRDQRRSALSAPERVPTELTKPTQTPAPIIAPMAFVPPGARIETALKPTPDQVRARWWWFLTALAIGECAASVLAGVVLAAVWQWDRNHDGVADHLQAHSCLTPNAHALADSARWPRDIDVGK